MTGSVHTEQMIAGRMMNGRQEGCMGVVSDLLKNIELPEMIQIRQKFDGTHIETDRIPEVIAAQMKQEKIAGRFKPGMRVAITAGSRGIANIGLIIRSIADSLKDMGCEPFIVPAMGSHGGATAEGQREVIESYGITEEAVGCKIVSSMVTVEIGKTETGRPVRIDKHAYEADGIVVCGRIKPHTGFRGPYESGIMKMMAIGLGKQYGAEIIHQDGFHHFREYIPMYGKAIIRFAPISCALAVLENAYDQTRELVALTPDEIITEEPKLLDRARTYMPRLLFDACDVLIIDEAGKNISGDGMDPNISGRFPTASASGGISAQRVAILDMTPESHGNGCGMGLADCISRRFYEKLDLEATYPNAITNTLVGELKIPMIMNNDRETIQLCIKTCNEIDHKNPRMIRIKNTLKLETVEISKALLEEAKAHPDIEVTGELSPMKFNEQGNLW